MNREQRHVKRLFRKWERMARRNKSRVVPVEQQAAFQAYLDAKAEYAHRHFGTQSGRH